MRIYVLAALFALVCSMSAFSQTTEFTYQGRLVNAGTPASGSYDLEFRLFDDDDAGTQQGPTLEKPNVQVANGIFSVTLDFGAQFPGDPRFLEISVRPSASGQAAFTTLTPRQPITSAPYSIKSANPGPQGPQGEIGPQGPQGDI